jgi:hypothetical protein
MGAGCGYVRIYPRIEEPVGDKRSTLALKQHETGAPEGAPVLVWSTRKRALLAASFPHYASSTGYAGQEDSVPSDERLVQLCGNRR